MVLLERPDSPPGHLAGGPAETCRLRPTGTDPPGARTRLLGVLAASHRGEAAGGSLV